MIVYVAGPYRGDVDGNIARAGAVAGALWEMGHTAICPHLNTAHFDTLRPDIPDKRYLEGDLDLLAVSDAILMIEGWETSSGASQERVMALRLDIPVYYYPDMPPLHPTEENSPQQARRFRQLLGQMYRTHLKKNADYSPANVQGPGEIGVVVRIWDKAVRLMSLSGFKVDVTASEFSAPREPANEPVVDTLMDLAVYGIIGLLVRSGDWGK
jgi:Domain of unknown function (DUF4406)